VYPVLHLSEHDVPSAIVVPSLQASPTSPSVGGATEIPVQGSGLHSSDPGLYFPAKQLGCSPDNVYPGMQDMAQDAPCGNTKAPAEQTLPNSPWAGGVTPLSWQALGVQVIAPGVKVPAEQTPLVSLVAM
jgi:hypothetical protein